MRHTCYAIALLCLLATACKEQAGLPPQRPAKKVPTKMKTTAPSPKWPTPTRKDGKIFAKLEPATKLDIGAKVELWWRASRSKNAFEDHGPYALGGVIVASKAPWGAEGGLAGAGIMAAMRKVVDRAKIEELRLRGISAGVAGPDFERGMITVDDAANSFFNKAVGRTKDGTLQVFADVDLKTP